MYTLEEMEKAEKQIRDNLKVQRYSNEGYRIMDKSKKSYLICLDKNHPDKLKVSFKSKEEAQAEIDRIVTKEMEDYEYRMSCQGYEEED